MSFILNIPMLANHRDKSSGGSYEARNVDAVVTGNASARVGRTNRFDDNHRLEVRPFRQLREGHQVCDRPDPPSYRAAVCVIEGIKEILGGAPCQLMFDVLMKVLFNRGVGLF